MNLFKLSFLTLIVSSLFPLQSFADTHPPLVDKVIHHAPQSPCLSKDIAESKAKELAVNSVKSYCRSEGFGWRSSLVKNLGKLDCHRCGDTDYTCGYSNVSLECRKADPQLSLSEWFSAER